MEVFSILTGRGGNGKGLLWELVQRTFGGYYLCLPVASLVKKIDSSTAATPDIANLRGMRCVGTSEPEAEEKLQEGTIKLFTGGDLLTGRPLYGQPFTFKPQFGLFIQTNNIPMFNQITKGGVRRNRVIPFPFNFVGEPKLSYERKGNPYIKNVLCRSDEWRDEFFNILLEYYPKAEGKQIDAISTPPLVAERTGEYIEDNNRVGVWWNERYEICEGEVILSRIALDMYKDDTKMKMGEREFKAALAFNDVDIKKITKGPYKGRMGIENYKRKDQTNEEAMNEQTIYEIDE
jgi:phage/plasmid-associated DNA primase